VLEDSLARRMQSGNEPLRADDEDDVGGAPRVGRDASTWAEARSSAALEAFAERARRELRATSETVRKRTVETRGDLTAQEAQIARRARDGLSNPEIGTRLFISLLTVK
jgi:DNA-binding NarL/FixJ family response regulator